jgi:hypothetical protein
MSGIEKRFIVSHPLQNRERFSPIPDSRFPISHIMDICEKELPSLPG